MYTDENTMKSEVAFRHTEKHVQKPIINMDNTYT